MAGTNGKRPSQVVRSRLSKCRRAMKHNRISSLLISNPSDAFYLTGFTGEDSAMLVTPRDVHIISDGRFAETINQECPWATRWMRKGSLDAEIATVCGKLGITKLSVQPECVTLASAALWKKKNRSTKVVHAPAILTAMRCLKDETELKTLRKAIRVAERAFLNFRDTVRVGDTELELAARLEFEMKCQGASGLSFSTIVAEGPNAALPHAHPGKRKVKKNSAILIDWGAKVGGYCSDLTRMIFVGSIPRKIGEVYRIVLGAQERAIAAVKPGARLCDVDAVARSYIAEAGFGDAFNHGLGHGIGVDVHESPRLSWQSKDTLKAGTVVTVEPGIYLPGIGGVRIEDDVLVTAKGHRVLSRLSKKIEDAVI